MSCSPDSQPRSDDEHVYEDKETLRAGAVGKSLTHEMRLGRASKKDLFFTNGDKKEQQ